MSGLYIHIPFCHSKCSYCDFYSTPDRRRESEYVDAVVSELRMRVNEVDEPFRTVYIGGGTPSVLDCDSLSRLVGGIGETIDMSCLDEFTIEANPEDIDESSVNRFMNMGINRVSIGLQTFDDGELKLISRVHDSATARRALKILGDSGINYNADLIFGLPGQSFEKWGESLDELLGFRPPHFSAYLLSVEPGTRMYAQLISGKISESPDDLVSAMYNRLISTAARRGYRHYEISNYALPGFQARHNSNYWNLTPYLGIGVSAHSFDGAVRRFNPRSLLDYMESIGSGRVCAIVDDETDTNRYNDLVITALRTSRGLDMDFVKKAFPSLAGQAECQASALVSSGLIERRGQRLVIPEERWLTSDAIMREMIL